MNEKLNELVKFVGQPYHELIYHHHDKPNKISVHCLLFCNGTLKIISYRESWGVFIEYKEFIASQGQELLLNIIWSIAYQDQTFFFYKGYI